MKKRVVVALGHRALGTTLPEQKEAVKKTAKVIGDLIEKGYISEIKDHENNTSCNAYSLVTNKNSAYSIKPFINCENYTTEGYGDF